eukprot:TRINITY_DN13965_c0_g1_i1.p1 TRINITY_DN13965_c0_g1~~TRINITY_DN13965_c0_g1_i1.p1  ORF type:complete len:113 (+),score=4.02 TRINITY_DN13965_c0_g1_i1:184-522(+)
MHQNQLRGSSRTQSKSNDMMDERKLENLNPLTHLSHLVPPKHTSHLIHSIYPLHPSSIASYVPSITNPPPISIPTHDHLTLCLNMTCPPQFCHDIDHIIPRELWFPDDSDSN